MSKKVLVVSEIKNNQLRNVSLEALTVAKQIADGGEIQAAVIGSEVTNQAHELVYYGAEKVVVGDDDKLKNYTPDGYAQALEQIIDLADPDVIVAGHTAIGKDVTAKLAARKKAGLISDATEIEVDDQDILVTAPIFSGKAFATKKIKEGVQFITIRPNNFEMGERDENAVGDVANIDVEIKDLRTVIQDVVRKTTAGVDLSEAKVVVAGGRGLKSAENFKMLDDLADVLGGAVGASRGACDAEYCDYSLQIGQTGKVVTPELYIACGISGAIQHSAGMSNSKVIVAINKDPEANIFNVADYGIVGDLFEVVPLLTEEFKQLTASVN
ncbi:electron transfer flavoprotein subunit alpha/FixB family protein [Aquibacillus sediminis]|uniref:electron transfer flavoprotein subunit alpha/FixB family protein n=1 Tax=Aquibacillus sediminis TaxID=2574734 RepID=UPI0011089471|nr:electron transfer flavoprotein subunit alpha/FixB family protein [Aquibacillus sediminis]